MIVSVTSLVLAVSFIACALIALISGSKKWVDRFLIGFVVFIFVAFLSLVYTFIKQ